MLLSPGGRYEYCPCQSGCVENGVSRGFDMRGGLAGGLWKGVVSNLVKDQWLCSRFSGCLVTIIGRDVLADSGESINRLWKGQWAVPVELFGMIRVRGSDATP